MDKDLIEALGSRRTMMHVILIMLAFFYFAIRLASQVEVNSAPQSSPTGWVTAGHWFMKMANLENKNGTHK